MNIVINQDSLLHDRQSTVVHEIVECLMDGVLILTEHGKVIYANSCARQLCRTLTHDIPYSGQVPDQIWHICEALIDSRDEFPDQLIMLEEDITLSPSVTIRIRVRWMEAMGANQTSLMVTLEDRLQAIKNRAMTEAHRYGLTSREAEVWLLKRANLTYKAIAAELHIAIDTVKKHVRNIHAKRDAFRWAND